MQEKIKKLIKDALKHLNLEKNSRPDEHPFGRVTVEHPPRIDFGDYSSNVGIVAGKDNVSKILEYLNAHKPEEIEKIELKNGFINFFLSREFFRGGVEAILNEGEKVGRNKTLQGKKIMVEYTDPNPFKPFHIGHLMTNTIGESVARILEHSGAEVSRANYQGDIGLHVAKALYGLLKDAKLAEKTDNHSEEAQNIGKAYALGAEAYESDEQAKKEIDEINKKIYARSDEQINTLYDWGFDATMKAFEDLYEILGTEFDYYFLESVMAEIGEQIVLENKGKVFEESDGAVIFRAEEHDPKLHTRVFITSQGLPTYETKELGLAYEKFKTEPDVDLSITITANEQAEYMKVVAKALSLIRPEVEKKMKHITHGMMRFAASKMSSRQGNVITGESLLRDVKEMVLKKMGEKDLIREEKPARNASHGDAGGDKVATDVAVSALKYSILKQSIGGDIIYDFEKSISFEGDSGPYLCYSYARASSVLEKAKKENILPDPHAAPAEAWAVEKILYKFPEIVHRSAAEYQPHYITHYLIELARAFNSFYGNNTIADQRDPTSTYKVALTFAFSFVMKTGLHLLGIQAPKKM